MLKKKIIVALQFVFFLGLGIFLVWWMARGIDENGWKQIRESLRHAKYWLFAPVLLMMLLSHYVRALRWKILMEPLGHKPNSFLVFNAVMVGYFANLLFPRLGEVLKCTILARYEKVGPDKLIGTIVAERAVDVVTLLVIFFLTIVSQIDVVGDYSMSLLRKAFSNGEQGFSVTKTLIITGILLAVLAAFYFVLTRLKHIGFIQKIRNILKGILSGVVSVRYMKKRGLFIFYSVLIWLLYLLSARIGFYALEEVSHLGIKPALSIISFGSIGMIVTQGGIGAYQYAVQETLSLYGISEIIGFIYGWVLWLAQTAVVLVGGVICAAILPFMHKKTNEEILLEEKETLSQQINT
ncbi:MAG: lysylphosphatidylglycerol synthase transmembrane domain-containing protein [Lacibacter sp.]